MEQGPDIPMELNLDVLDVPRADARATWAVSHNGQCIGYVSEDVTTGYRVDSAGLAVPVPHGRFPSREAAAEAIVTARATAPLLRTGTSGLHLLDEEILRAERAWATEPAAGVREREADRLGISPVQYKQILRWLRDDPRAYAYDAPTVNRLRARHVAACTRRARLSRDGALARAS
jgi:Protein of unknown function (DUF3263)